MKKKLIIHIGSYKTGSTSIQYNLFKYHSYLASKGIDYLSPEGEIKKVNGRQLFFRRDKTYIEKIFNSSNSPIHIVSNEGLWDRENLKNKFLKIARESEAYDEVCVLAYIRRQDKFFESLYKQEQKVGAWYGAGLNPKDFYKVCLERKTLDYFYILKQYSDLFGKESINIRCFESEYLFDNDAVLDFFNFLQIDFPPNETAYRLNETISPEFALICKEYYSFLKKIIDLGVVEEKFYSDADERFGLIRSEVIKRAESLVSKVKHNEDFELVEGKLKSEIRDAFRKSNAEMKDFFNLSDQLYNSFMGE